MSLRALAIVVALDLAVAGGASFLWLKPAGNWPEPVAVTPEIAVVSAVPGTESATIDLSRLTETVDRPLFVASRRPPPPPEAEGPRPAKDALESVKIVGVFVSEDGKGGAIVQVDGKVRRVLTGESIEAWTLSRIDGRQVLLTREGGETTTLHLGYAPQPNVPPPAPVLAAQNPGGPGAQPARPGVATGGRQAAISTTGPVSAEQRMQDRVARRNEYLKAVAAARKANREALETKKKQ